jgi:hypothetical protein
LLCIVGVANTVVDASVNTLLQRTTPEEVLGRVFGVLESVAIAAVAVGSMVAPALIAGLGIEGALVAAGLVLPVLALLARPALRRIDAADVPPTHRLERLRAISMFAPLGSVELEGIAAGLEETTRGAGDEVVRQGDRGERFFIIDRGEVEVFADGRLLRTMAAGDYFGEIALIRDIPRTASVVARTDVELLALERDRFLASITRSHLGTQAADAVVAARLG